MTTDTRVQAVLFESEAALRLVDQGIHDLRAIAPTDPRLYAIPAIDLPESLELANQQILSVLAHLRETRATLQNAPFVKLQTTNDKIREVTAATEDAAINIMDACDRANVLVDSLDIIDAEDVPDREKANGIRSQLRDELFEMMGALQFQDITAQQLSFTSAVLMEIESRLEEIAQHLDTKGIFERLPHRSSNADVDVSGGQGQNEEVYDPNATTKNADIRQALADEIFTSIKAPAA